MSISAIGPGAGIAPIKAPEISGGSGPGQASFENALSNAIQQVEQYRVDADTSVQTFLAGEGEDLHQVALKTQQAELAFEMFLQVRNKVVQAYQEVMRMQV
ncbi:MAG: flagellar hook-basal body complex protein FliE [bacterium]|nr:flagellar hook-basal body complex protein FliE [bacterium]